MKKKLFYAATIFAVAVAATSCDDDDNKAGNPGNPGGTTGGDETEELVIEGLPGITFNASNVSADAPAWAGESWASEESAFDTEETYELFTNAADGDVKDVTAVDDVYTLDGTYKMTESLYVKDGETLKIAAGTIVVTDGRAAQPVIIMIEQGGKIEAEGTDADPIILTSELRSHGAWGGVHICGKAKCNNGGGNSEIGSKPYGGEDDADNSGFMKYVRIEYAGRQLDPETEANGFTFYGVGSGTVVENCCAYKGADDGYEWFGGKVQCKNLVSIDNQDDSFDWTYGFTGTINGAYAKHLSTSCDHLIEGDSNKDLVSTPVSCPTITDAVLVGVDSNGGNRAMRLRRATRIKMSNVSISGKEVSLNIRSNETKDYFVETPAAFENVKASGSETEELDVI